jgi:hypothetical protein
MKFLLKISIFILLFVNSHTFYAQKDTLRVLFVGNSYTYYSDLPKMVSVLSKTTSTYIKSEMSAVGGARLKYHYKQQHELKTKTLIKNGKYDIVVLQEQSMGTITNKKEFLSYSEKLSKYIKKHNAKPYFFVTWSRKNTPQTQSIITNTYKKAARLNNGVLVLVGEVWKAALQKRPNIKLYDKDGSHPSKLGTFLAASVFIKKLTGANIPHSVVYSLPNNKNDYIFCIELVSNFIE